jgi:hypothetical protein
VTTTGGRTSCDELAGETGVVGELESAAPRVAAASSKFNEILKVIMVKKWQAGEFEM